MIFMQTLDSGCRRYQWTVLHTVLFSPSIIFAPLNLQMVQPILNSPRHGCV